MTKALQISPELSFDPARFCSVSADTKPRNGKYVVWVALKKGERHGLEFSTLKDAIDAVTYITEKVNEATATTLLESGAEMILAPARELGPLGPTPGVEDMIKRAARETAEAFWNTPIEPTRESIVQFMPTHGEPVTVGSSTDCPSGPLVVTHGEPVTIAPGLYWPASFGPQSE